MKTKTPYVKTLLIVVGLILSSFVFCTNSLQAQILVQTSFEGSNPFAGFSTGQACCSYSVTATTAKAHDGLQSFKAEVRLGDPAVSSGYRAEIRPNNLDDAGDMWYGYSTLTEKMGGDGGHCIQWHPNNGTGSATLSIYTGENTFNVVRNMNGANYYQSSGGAWPVKPIVLNRWYDIVFHVKWSTGSDGIIEIWIDGAKYYDFRGQTMPAEGVYLKFGMNRWNVQNDWVVYYDNLKIGRDVTYNDVAPTPNSVPANQAPIARAGNDINISLPTVLATLDGSASSDPDGTIASYSWSRVSGPTGFSLLNPLSAITSVTSLLQGSYVFRLTVTDNKGATSTDDVTVTVAGLVNQSPTANAGTDINLTLPSNSTTLTGTGTDPDGTVASYAWSRVSGPTTYTLANASSASTALTNLVQGTYVFRLTVTDDKGATTSDNISVTVNAAPNVAPTANAGTDITMTLPTNSTTLNGSGIDSDGNISSYAWTRISGPTVYTLGSATSANATLTNLVQGVYTFRLTVTDNRGATATDNIIVTVNAAPNQAPTANAGNDITISLPTNATSLNGSGTDPDGNIATYAWTKVSGPTSFTLANPNGGTTALTGLVQGTYVFKLTVTDNSGATASDNVTVTVNAAPNQAPAADAGNAINITLPVNSTTLSGIGTDADGTISSYAWSRVSGPTTYSLSNPNAAITALTGLVQGTYVFRLTVTDNSGASATDNVTVTVNPATAPPNQVPSVNAGVDITITLPVNSANLAGAAADADGTIASYAWTRVSGPATFTIVNPSAATTAITGLVQGTYVFRLTVTDDGGATATDNITIVVNPAVNQAPIARAGNDIAMTLPTNATTLNGSGSADPDGTILTYAWTKVSGPTTFTIGNANIASTSLTGLVQGSYVFRLTVTDNNGVSASDNVTITVNAAITAPNQAPGVNAGSNISITLPTNSTNLTGSAIDADGTIASYAWTRLSGPTTFALANASASSTALTNLVQGTYVFRLTVTDNGGATATDDITVTVNAAPAPPPHVNQRPVAKAGPHADVILPNSKTTLSGTLSADPDGLIVSYEWTQLTGPSTAVIADKTASVSDISALVMGDYSYELKVTDNDGAISRDTVTVSVKTKDGDNLFVNLYPNPGTDKVTLQYYSPYNGPMKVVIYDAKRTVVMQQSLNKDVNSLSKEIDISKLRPGFYFLQLFSPVKRQMFIKFVKR